jgi:hypothetical protein
MKLDLTVEFGFVSAKRRTVVNSSKYAIMNSISLRRTGVQLIGTIGLLHLHAFPIHTIDYTLESRSSKYQNPSQFFQKMSYTSLSTSVPCFNIYLDPCLQFFLKFRTSDFIFS